MSSTTINAKNVKTLLNSLLYSTRERTTNPLEELLIVELLSLRNPLHLQDRGFVLAELITEIIVEILEAHRLANGLTLPDLNDTREVALGQISHDVATDNIELIAWSWFYYRFVRSDLNIKPKDFSSQAAMTARTRRRYQAHALRRLVHILFQREVAALRMQRKTHLLRRFFNQDPIFGREEALQFVRDLPLPRVIQVVGRAGVGKVAFVRQVLYDWAKSDKVEDVLWLTAPSSIQEIENLTTNCSWTSQPVVIVLEDVSSLDEDGLFRYLQEPLSVQVIIIHSALLSCPTDFVLLDEIDRSAAIQYANYLKGRYYVTAGISDQEVETVLAVAGGKPYQIRQTLYELLQN